MILLNICEQIKIYKDNLKFMVKNAFDLDSERKTLRTYVLNKKLRSLMCFIFKIHVLKSILMSLQIIKLCKKKKKNSKN